MISIDKLKGTFTCCLPYLDGSHRILIGTTRGNVYEGTLIALSPLKTRKLSHETYIRVLKSRIKSITKLKGSIRAIKRLDPENFIISSDSGAITSLNIKSRETVVIQRPGWTKREKIWRLLVLDENNFVSIGNYDILKLWTKSSESNSYTSSTLSENGHAMFCLDWVDLDDGHFVITNNYQGITNLWDFRHMTEGGLAGEKIHSFDLAPNLQKCVSLYKEFLFCTDYFGTFHIYKRENRKFREIEEYTLSSDPGNWVHNSDELDMILIGNDEYLIYLSKDLDTVEVLDLSVRQIITVDGIDLVLTPKNVVKPNHNKKSVPKELQKYKYTKIALIGASQVGKTCFCRYLELNEFQDTISSFGRHVWTIFNKGKKEERILYYDLAGQGSELFTYFPMVQDADIILIFYNGLLRETFDQAIEYYKELREKYPQMEYYFIQTHAEQRQRIGEKYIRQKLKELDLNYDDILIKASPKDGRGFEEYQEKVIDQINWNDTHPIIKFNIYDIVEQKIHELYSESFESITLQEFSRAVRVKERTAEKIILAYYRQGIVEYLESRKEIILNNEIYEETHSDIAGFIDEEGGYASTKEIMVEIGTDSKRRRYIEHILQYYRDRQVGIFFCEDDVEHEIVVFPRKLMDYLRIPDNLQSKLPKTGIEFEYQNYELEINTILQLLSNFPLKLLAATSKEILLETEESNLILLRFNQPIGYDDDQQRVCLLSLNKSSALDYELEKRIIKHLVDMLEENLVDISSKEEIKKDIPDDPIENLKFLLRSPFEKPYFDFKRQISYDKPHERAELIKDVIALSNSSFMNNNTSYLAIGFGESNNQVDSVINVDNIGLIEQRISHLLANFLNRSPSIDCFTIRIYDLFQWQLNNEISSNILFSSDHMKSNNIEKVLLIRIKRETGDVFEFARDFAFTKSNKPKQYSVGDSWFRISSHTFKLKEYQRQILRRK